MTWQDGQDGLAWAAAVVLVVPLAVLAVECLAVRRRPAAPVPERDDRLRAAVLIPAHDEEPVIGATLRTLAPQLGLRDRVLVVADNCTDRTAAIAWAHGAWVLERTDPDRRGKGYALAFGLDALRADPPDVVVMLDADCRVGDGALARLVEAAHTLNQPVQAAYRMDPAPAPAPGPDRRLAAFAFRVKNVVRPLGLKRLGLPCLLTGTGMAFPWSVIRKARLGHGHIVEDMQLAVDLAIAGHPATFLPDADVRGEFPSAEAAAGSQRKRWEHGHLRVMRSELPRLVFAGVRRGRPLLLALALELSVPPVSALVMLTAAVLGLLVLWAALGGAWGPAALLGTAAAAAGLGLAAAWRAEGRDVLPARALVRAPWYAVRKVPLYLSFLVRPQAAWVRTQREP